MKNKILTIVFIVFLILLILTVSIGVPIYCRFLYYIQIKTLHIEETSGYSYEIIKEAYDEVLNYLTLPNKPFGTGQLKYSESGMSHFVDCKKLFNLNISVLLISLVSTITLFILNKTKKITFINFKNKTPYFYSGVFGVLTPVILALLMAINFDKAFTIFHKIFFPGKDNWVFDSRYDQIIRILPQEFFRNCAIIIGITLLILASLLVFINYRLANKEIATSQNKQCKRNIQNNNKPKKNRQTK